MQKLVRNKKQTKVDNLLNLLKEEIQKNSKLREEIQFLKRMGEHANKNFEHMNKLIKQKDLVIKQLLEIGNEKATSIGELHTRSDN